MGHNIKPAKMRECFAHNDEINSSLKSTEKIQIKNISPFSLDLSSRFDIIVKTIYAIELLEKGVVSDFTTDMYLQHLKVWNTFKEPCTFDQKDWFDAKPCIKKASANDFKTSFEKTIQSLKDSGFDNSKSIVPVTKNLFPLNGAHRIATALALGMNTMPVQILSANWAFRWNANFFINRGFDRKYADFAMLQFLIHSPQVATLIFWPEAASHKKIVSAQKMLRDKLPVLYSKQILINKKGVASLTEHAYGQQNWLSAKIKMLQTTFNDEVTKKPVIVMFAITKQKFEMDAFKMQLRKHFSLNEFKSSVHISDFHAEAAIIGEMVLNDNSVMFMNRHKGQNCKEVSRELALRKSLKEVNPGLYLHTQDIMVDSGAVMSFFGLRKRSDIDVISEHGVDTSLLGFKGKILVEEHKIKIHGPIHGRPSTELFSNTSYFGYCHGLKFVSLEQLRRYKLKRGKLNKASRDKDWGDAKTIESFLQANSALQEPSQEPQPRRRLYSSKSGWFDDMHIVKNVQPLLSDVRSLRAKTGLQTYMNAHNYTVSKPHDSAVGYHKFSSLYSAKLSDYHHHNCKYITAQTEFGKVILKQEPMQWNTKCGKKEVFPQFCDRPVGDIATYEASMLLGIEYVPLTIGKFLHDHDFLNVLSQCPGMKKKYHNRGVSFHSVQIMEEGIVSYNPQHKNAADFVRVGILDFLMDNCDRFGYYPRWDNVQLLSKSYNKHNWAKKGADFFIFDNAKALSCLGMTQYTKEDSRRQFDFFWENWQDFDNYTLPALSVRLGKYLKDVVPYIHNFVSEESLRAVDYRSEIFMEKLRPRKRNKTTDTNPPNQKEFPINMIKKT